MRYLICTIAVFLTGSVVTADELVLLTGQSITGKLVSIAEQSLSFQSGDGPPAVYPVKAVRLLDFKTPVVAIPRDLRYDEIELTDGSLLRLTQLKITGKQVSFTPALQPEQPAPKLVLPLSNLFWYLRNADDTTQRDEFQKLLKARGKRDLFVVRTSSGLNPISGTLLDGSDTGDRVRFEREDGQTVTLPLTRASGGLIFNQPAPSIIAPTLCKVQDLFGNVLYATKAELVAEGLQVQTVSGATVEYPSLKAIAKLDFSQGNLLYLSDINPAIDYSPADKDGPLGEQFFFQPQLQNDRAVFGAEIVLDGQKFAKGVSIPRGTSVTYKLDGSYREFKTTVGILDGNNRDSWSLKLIIELDGRVVFDEPITKKDKLRTLALNIKDANELKLTVEPIGEFQGDQLNLAEARLQK